MKASSRESDRLRLSGGAGESLALQVGLQLSEGLGHILAAVAETDVAGLVVDGAGEKEDACFADEVIAKGEDVLLLGLETSEADGAGIRRSPVEKMGMAREERRELRKIAQDDLQVAINEFLAMTKGEGRQEFAGSAGADGGVVFE